VVDYSPLTFELRPLEPSKTPADFLEKKFNKYHIVAFGIPTNMKMDE
jgi:hypothetical protein